MPDRHHTILLPNIKLSYFLISDLFAEKMWGKKAKGGQEEEQRLPEAKVTGALSQLSRLQRCIATINRWTDYCNNHEIIVCDYWLSQKHRKIIGPDGLEK